MALTVTDRGEFQTAAGGAITHTATSAAFSPAAGSLLVAMVTLNAVNNGASSDETFAVTDNIGDTGGTAWTQQASCSRGAVASPQYMEKVAIWTRVVGTTPGASKTVTVSGTYLSGASNTSTDGWFYATLAEVAGQHATPIGASVSPSLQTSITQFSETLSGVPASTSAIFSVIHSDADSTIPTVPAGWTPHQSEGPAWGASSATGYINGSGSQTLIWTNCQSDPAKRYLSCAVEIVAAAAVAPVSGNVPTLTPPGRLSPGRFPPPMLQPYGTDIVAATPLVQDASTQFPAPIPPGRLAPSSVFNRPQVLQPGINANGPFPASVSSNGRYLLDQYGQPWMMHADSPWYLPMQSPTIFDTYFADRVARNINTFIVDTHVHQNGTGDGTNYNGDFPFTGTAFQSPIKDAYWRNVDYQLKRCAENGITVVMFLAWFGFTGSGEGWSTEISASTDAQMNVYGQQIGARYKDYPNIIWAVAGDHQPDATLATRTVAMVAGLRAAGANQLITAQSQRHFDAFSDWSSSGFLQLNSLYTDDDPGSADLVTEAAVCYGRSGPVPFFLVEGHYGPFSVTGFTNAQVRRENWKTVLAGGLGGATIGIEHVWGFDGSWATYYQDVTIAHRSIMADFFDALGGATWSALAPDSTDTFMTAGEGTAENQAAAAFSVDCGVIYKPAATSTTVDLTEFAGGHASMRVRWFDPTNGTYTAVGTFSTAAPQAIAHPGNNAGGDPDWVMLVDAPIGSNQTTTAQIGTITLAGIAGTSTPGGATTTAQVGAITLAGIAGTSSFGNATTTAQIGTLTLAGIAGTSTGGPVTTTAQVGIVTLAGIAGTSSGGPVTTTAQIGAITLTAIAGTSSNGGISTTAQVGLITLTGVQGASSGGPASTTAQVGLITLTAVPGTSTSGLTTIAQVGLITLTGIAGTSSGRADLEHGADRRSGPQRRRWDEHARAGDDDGPDRGDRSHGRRRLFVERRRDDDGADRSHRADGSPGDIGRRPGHDRRPDRDPHAHGRAHAPGRRPTWPAALPSPSQRLVRH
jgi:hypothetical protein